MRVTAKLNVCRGGVDHDDGVDDSDDHVCDHNDGHDDGLGDVLYGDDGVDAAIFYADANGSHGVYYGHSAGCEHGVDCGQCLVGS